MLGAVGTYLAAKAAIRRDWKKMPGLRGDGPALGRQLRGLLLGFASDLEQGGLHLEMVGFCLLADSSALVRGPLSRLLAGAQIFNSPGWVVTPLGVLASAFLALGLYLIGSLSLGFRWRGGLYLLVAPLLFTLAASALHQYPFHGRLLLFLVPMIHLPIAEGAAARRAPWLARADVCLGNILAFSAGVPMFYGTS